MWADVTSPERPPMPAKETPTAETPRETRDRLDREEMSAQLTYERAKRELSEMLDLYRNIERGERQVPTLGALTDALLFERGAGQAYKEARDAAKAKPGGQ